MLRIEQTDSDNFAFQQLVSLLDKDLAERDGADNIFYSQFNKINLIKHAIVAYEDDIPCGCGAVKQFDTGTMEVKRMYVLPAKRGKGIADKILSALETWAAELGFTRCVLETGKRQPEAIRLYERNGYHRIDNYGQYAGVENSLCFEKKLN